VRIDVEDEEFGVRLILVLSGVVLWVCLIGALMQGNI
jgi:hypothetical protein